MFGLTYHLTPVENTTDVYQIMPTKTTWMIALAPSILLVLAYAAGYAYVAYEERQVDKNQTDTLWNE